MKFSGLRLRADVVERVRGICKSLGMSPSAVLTEVIHSWNDMRAGWWWRTETDYVQAPAQSPRSSSSS